MEQTRPEQAPRTRKTRVIELAGLSFGHMLNDSYVNFVAPLWPQIRQKFALSNSDVGSIIFWWGLTTNFGQPIFGYMTDRWRPRHIIVGATLISCLFFSFIGYATTLPAFVAFLILGGMGVAIFHPRGGALAVAASGARRALGMGVFSAGGALGYAFGYLASPYLHGLTGSMKGLMYAAPVGIIGAVILLLINVEGGAPKRAAAFHLREHVLPYLPKIAPLMLVMILRSATVVAFSSFIPQMLADQGKELIAGGHAGFFFIAGGAVGGMIGGHISDRLGRRGITIVTLLMSPPFLYSALHAAALPSLTLFFSLLFLAGFITRCAEPTNITHTQEILPEGASLAASLGMGGAWGVAGLIAPVIGRMADAHGVPYALGWAVFIPIVAAIAALFIPRGNTHQDQART